MFTLFPAYCAFCLTSLLSLLIEDACQTQRDLIHQKMFNMLIKESGLEIATYWMCLFYMLIFFIIMRHYSYSIENEF